MSFNHNLAQPRARRDVDLQILRALLCLIAEKGFVRIEARFALRVTSFRRHANPLQLALQCLLALALGFLFLLEPDSLLLEP